MVAMAEKWQVVAWMQDAAIADDDPYRAIKLRARELAADCDRRVVEAAAGRVAEFVSLLGNDSFDPAATWDAAVAAGLREAELDSGGNVAVVLGEIEAGL
jgi:hypothetical protein